MNRQECRFQRIADRVARHVFLVGGQIRAGFVISVDCSPQVYRRMYCGQEEKSSQEEGSTQEENSEEEGRKEEEVTLRGLLKKQRERTAV